MNNRRKILIVLGAGALTTPFTTLAQQEHRVRRIGFFTRDSSQSHAGSLTAFREGMAALRWVEGRDYVIDARYANAVEQAVERVAADLVATQPDVLLVPADDAVRIFAPRTKTIPIVFASGSDPVGLGFAASLQRPGGNITGQTALTQGLAAKRLQLLKEVFPPLRHAVVLFEAVSVTSVASVKEIEAAAVRLGIRVTPIGLGHASDIEPAFKRGAVLGAQGYLLAGGSVINSQREAIADRLLRARVPAISGNVQSVELGGLMSYGPANSFRRIAWYVDKILKGAKPADLPIQQPTEFELVINMKTAKALGITIPQSILVQATKVIE